jgi:hypothetical protein
MDALKNQPGKTGPGDGGDTDTVKQAAEEQMRRDVLASILDPAARERCTSLALCSGYDSTGAFLLSGQGSPCQSRAIASDRGNPVAEYAGWEDPWQNIRQPTC